MDHWPDLYIKEKLFLKKTPAIKARQIPRNSVISGIIKFIFSIFIYLSNLLLARFGDFGLFRLPKYP